MPLVHHDFDYWDGVTGHTSVTVTLYDASHNVVSPSPYSLTEIGTTGRYTAAAGSLAAGVYRTETKVAGQVVDRGTFRWDGTQERSVEAGAVWDEATSAHTTTGTTGKAVGDLDTDMATLLARATEARLAELDSGNLPNDIDALLARLTSTRAGYLDELGPTNIPADIDTLLGRLTASRATNLDEIYGTRLTQLDSSQIPNTLANIETAIGNVPGNVWGESLPVPPTGTPTTYGGQVHAFTLGELDPAGLWLTLITCCAELVDNIWSATPEGMAAEPPAGSFGWMMRLLAAVAGKRNVRVNPTAFAGGKLTAATLRVYANSVDATLDQNHLIELTIGANYTGDNLDDFLSTGP